MKFKTIVIDPPWSGPGSVPRFPKGNNLSVIPYSCQTGIQTAAMRIPDIAEEASQLWMWACSRNLGDAFLLAQMWGFTYRGLFIWMKPLGMGRHVRHQCEFLLYCGRSGAKIVPPKECPVQVHRWPRPKRHSEKPAEAYALIERLSEGPRIDIFARQKRPGFTPWGNQAPVEEALKL